MNKVKWFVILLAGLGIVGLAGCNAPAKHISKIQLGMSPTDVENVMGKKYFVRASKVFEDGNTNSVWEYTSGISLNPRDFWIFFENGKVVQWGQPGDFTMRGGKAVPVEAYKPHRADR